MAHPGAGQVVGNHRASCPAANDDDAGGQQLLLPLKADAWEDGLAEVAGEV
jgi:hypothetical protein